MQQPFHQTAPDRLEVRGGGGCMALFGIPFFLAGVFMILVAFKIVPMENAADQQPWSWPLIGLMGLAFMAVGGGLLFGRTWTVIDRGRASISKQWGLLVPMKQEELSLTEYRAVVLEFEKGDSDSVDRYPVIVKARSAGKDLTLYSGTDYGAARAQATQLATFLSFPLEDATTTHTAVRAADQIDEPLQARLRRDDDQGAQVVRPLDMRSQVEETSGALRITIPGPGFGRAYLLQLIIPAGIMIFFIPSALGFFTQSRTPGGVQGIFVGFAVLFFGIFPLLSLAGSAIAARRRRTCVSVTPGELLVEEREVWRTRATRIPVADILDLDYDTVQATMGAAQQIAAQRYIQAGHSSPLPPGSEAATPGWLNTLGKLVKSKGITVKSRTGLTTFGAGLPDDEVRYLHALIRQALAR